MPVHDYDWGPQFNAQDGSGIASNAAPRIKKVLKMFAPKVDADGNELGGVPVVLLDAPLGTYLGWNVTAGGEEPFHKNQICNYVGGMIPFARTAEERKANRDPRPSLQERVGGRHAESWARMKPDVRRHTGQGARDGCRARGRCYVRASPRSNTLFITRFSRATVAPNVFWPPPLAATAKPMV